MVYVALLLEQSNVHLTFENLVVAAFRLFPNAFSLVGFPEYPDAGRINRTLLQCRPQYRNFIDGKGSTQFVVTENGKSRAEEISAQLQSGKAVAKGQRRSAPRTISHRIENEIRSSAAFDAWQSQRNIQSDDFYHLLHLLPGAPQAAVRENFGIIRRMVSDSADDAVQAFIKAVELQYSKELS